jgi:hypothetical protein
MDSIPAFEFRAALALLGLPRARIASMLGTTPRNLRRYCDGSRPIPFGIAVLGRLIAAGVLMVEQIEAAGRANGSADPGGGADPSFEGAVAPIDLGSTAAKTFAIPFGACHWPAGDPQSRDFDYCGRPVVAAGQPYCARHRALSLRPRRASAHRFYRLDRRAPAPELDREDSSIVDHAAREHLATVPIELAG